MSKSEHEKRLLSKEQRALAIVLGAAVENSCSCEDIDAISRGDHQRDCWVRTHRKEIAIVQSLLGNSAHA